MADSPPAPSPGSSRIAVTPSILLDTDLDSATSTAQHLHFLTQVPPKRVRVQLNCTYCRVIKLQCDRQSPSHQCIKRGRESQCNFPTSLPRRNFPTSMQNRLQHLESLVKDVMTGQTPRVLHSESLSGNEAAENPSGLAEGDQVSSASQLNTENRTGKPLLDALSVASGTVVQSTNQTAYIGATHWAAIFDDIEEVKSYFNGKEDVDHSMVDDAGLDVSMIFQLQTPTTAKSLIAALPQRPIVDKLVSFYFKSPFPSRYLIHKPTFQRQYKEFWEHPTGTPLAWIALLYVLMSDGTFTALGAGEDNPDGRGTHLQMNHAYRRWCSQCLILSNYNQPGPHTLEALLIYLEGQFALSNYDQINCYISVGAAVRLSLRMGLHRDATKVAGNISVFQAEIRRRLWHFLIQVDLLSSFHVGLPGMVLAIESDTEYPRNLRDEDFHESSTELPAGRPESEMTSMSYIICKGRLCGVFGEIAVQANRLSLPTYDEVLQLDDALNQAFAKVPAFFQVVPLELAITDSVELIIQRFSIAVLYYKSRCVLHRKYLLKEKDDHMFSFSKEASLDASMQLLRYQSSIHNAVRPNNLLSRETWFVSSLSIHDFLLAATIVYLTLIQAIEGAKNDNLPRVLEQHRELITLLERSHTVWSETREMMSEAKKASGILDLMVKKVKLAIGASNILSTESIPGASTVLQLPSNGPASLSGTLGEYLNNGDACSSRTFPTTTPSSFGLQFNYAVSIQGNPIETMLDMPMDFDWETFDNHLRPHPVMDQPWNDLSPPNFESENYNDYCTT